MLFRQKYFFSKEDLYELYINQKKSIRILASELKTTRSTVRFYLEKFEIKRRTKSEAIRERMERDPNWNKNLKEAKRKIGNYSEFCKQLHQKKRDEKIRGIEQKYNLGIKEILDKLYYEKGFSIAKIAKTLGFCNEVTTKLMKENNIQIKPCYLHITSLKGERHPFYGRTGEKHPRFGKTWEELYGIEEAKKRKEIWAVRSRELIIERMKKGKFPFFRTKIERMMFDEMNKRDFFFTFQYGIHNFICDFALPNQKIVIECDGDFWHANPLIYDRKNLGKLNKIQRDKIIRDQIKDEYLRKNEWIVLRFFETDIKKDVVQCVNKIETKINWLAFKKAGDVWEEKSD